MNLVQLKAFIMVVDHGSFSAAAREMGVSQPAVTMQVQALEADLGVTLLNRGYRSVGLTESGTVLWPHARAILAEIERARSGLAVLASTVTGHLALAASTTPGQYMAPRLLGGFLRENPEVAVSISVADTAQVVDAVVTGRADLGMTGAIIKGARADFEAVGTDDIVLICPPSHPFAAASGTLPISEIVAEPLVMRESGSGTRQIAEEALREAGADTDELVVVTEMSTGEAIVSAVEGGLGLGMVSSLVAGKALELGTVSLVSAEGFPISRPIYVVTARTTLTRAAEAFLGYLRSEAKR